MENDVSAVIAWRGVSQDVRRCFTPPLSQYFLLLLLLFSSQSKKTTAESGHLWKGNNPARV